MELRPSPRLSLFIYGNITLVKGKSINHVGLQRTGIVDSKAFLKHTNYPQIKYYSND